MTQQPAGVAIAVEPFLLRSLLHATLTRDGRVDSHLCPLAADPVTWATEIGARMLVVSKPVRCSDLCVVLLSSAGETILVSYEGACQRFAYAGTAQLCDQIATHAATLMGGQPASSTYG